MNFAFSSTAATPSPTPLARTLPPFTILVLIHRICIWKFLRKKNPPKLWLHFNVNAHRVQGIRPWNHLKLIVKYWHACSLSLSLSVYGILHTCNHSLRILAHTHTHTNALYGRGMRTGDHTRYYLTLNFQFSSQVGVFFLLTAVFSSAFSPHNSPFAAPLFLKWVSSNIRPYTH